VQVAYTSVVRVDPRLLKIIVCPQCHSDLSEQEATLDCAACALTFPVRDGIPVLLLDEATPL
jgi:uncharacterized protein